MPRIFGGAFVCTFLIYNMEIAKHDIPTMISDIHNNGINYYTREIYFHSYFVFDSEEPGVDYRSAVRFVKNLHILESLGDSDITVHMHSEGGSWSDGMAIFDAIRLAVPPVKIIAYAQASSQSGIILQAADHRVMMPHTYFMLHYGELSVHASSVAVREAVKYNDHECKTMLDIFANRAVEGEFFTKKGFDLKQVRRFIDREISKHGDWHLTAQEAVYYGFADEVLGI